MTSIYPPLITPFNPPVPPAKYLYTPAGWNDTWLAALAASGSAPTWLAYLTDSIGQGAYADNWLTHGWPQQVTAGLQLLYPTEFAEYWPIGDSVLASGNFTPTPPWVVGDTSHATLTAGGTGLNAGTLRWAGGMNNPAATFTTPIACTGLEIHYLQPYGTNGTTWSYTVDGGSTQTITNAAGDTVQHKTSVGLVGLPNTTHTLVFTGQSADNAVLLMGVTCYPNGAGGVGVGYARACLAGVCASYLVQSGQQPPSGLQYQLWSGLDGSGARHAGFPTQPSLAIIEYGVNDSQTQTPAQFSYAMNKLIDALRLGQSNCSILLVTAANPDPNSTDITANALQRVSTYYQYSRALREIAHHRNCALVDFDSKWGSRPLALGFLEVLHAPHPTTAGHTDMATTILGMMNVPRPA